MAETVAHLVGFDWEGYKAVRRETNQQASRMAWVARKAERAGYLTAERFGE